MVADRKMAGSKKNARRGKAWILFQDESGVSQRPSVRRTWAPKGETPVLIHAFNWSKMSVCAALGYRWDGRRSSGWNGCRATHRTSIRWRRCGEISKGRNWQIVVPMISRKRTRRSAVA